MGCCLSGLHTFAISFHIRVHIDVVVSYNYKKPMFSEIFAWIFLISIPEIRVKQRGSCRLIATLSFFVLNITYFPTKATDDTNFLR